MDITDLNGNGARPECRSITQDTPSQGGAPQGGVPTPSQGGVPA
jgi:hypothetical protein